MGKQFPKRVALLVSTATQWERDVVAGINHYVRKNEPWHIYVEPRSGSELHKVPEGWRGEGIIARVQNQAMANAIDQAGIPAVNVSSIRLKGVVFHRVTTDLKAAVRLAVEHFRQRGFRNFGYFSLLGLSYVSDHQRAYVTHLKELGFSCELYTSPAEEGAIPDWTMDMSDLAAWLQALPKPVGVFTWNASSARQLLYGCQWAELAVPEEVAVLSGADDNLLCELTSVPVSGITAAARTIGYESAALLDRLMKGRRASRSPMRIAPTGVTSRQSTDTFAITEKPLVEALRFIRDHANQSISVQNILEHVSISRRSLERLFIRVLNRTPAEEIRRVHFERAKFLIEQTDLSERDVAAASGFGSPEYMGHVFKRRMGIAPIKHRRKTRTHIRRIA